MVAKAGDSSTGEGTPGKCAHAGLQRRFGIKKRSFRGLGTLTATFDVEKVVFTDH